MCIQNLHSSLYFADANYEKYLRKKVLFSSTISYHSAPTLYCYWYFQQNSLTSWYFQQMDTASLRSHVQFMVRSPLNRYMNHLDCHIIHPAAWLWVIPWIDCFLIVLCNTTHSIAFVFFITHIHAVWISLGMQALLEALAICRDGFFFLLLHQNFACSVKVIIIVWFYLYYTECISCLSMNSLKVTFWKDVNVRQKTIPERQMKEFEGTFVKERQPNVAWYGGLHTVFTWEEGEHHWHPANDIGPGEPPVSVAFPIVVNSHTSVHCHC